MHLCVGGGDNDGDDKVTVLSRAASVGHVLVNPACVHLHAAQGQHTTVASALHPGAAAGCDMVLAVHSTADSTTRAARAWLPQ